MESDETLNLENLDENLYEAFRKAYSGLAESEIRHAFRNFVQVVRGLIEIGDKSDIDVDTEYVDVANVLAHWCVRSLLLEKSKEGKRSELLGEEMDSLVREISARLADWLLGLDVLKANPELFKAFIRGAIVAGGLSLGKDEGEPQK
ncbi:MAG: hypothetical protein PHO53_01445 [Actinomycetota bacterium]|nr:hypothetical protein [Actinomycetota bacterium]